MAKSMSPWRLNSMSIGYAPQWKAEAPCQLFFPIWCFFEACWLCYSPDQKPHMHIRVGLVLLSMTMQRKRSAWPREPWTPKPLHFIALSRAINPWLKGFLSHGGKNRQFSQSGMISFFAFMFQKSSKGIKRWKGHIFTTCESWQGGHP